MLFAKKKSTPIKRKGLGTLGTIMFLLLTSAGLRLLTSADLVLAATDAGEKINDNNVTQEQSVQSPITPETLSPILVDLERREKKVQAQEEKIEKRMRALKTADAKIEERLAILRAAEENLRATIALASTAAEDDLARLTAVYENMKPKTAAALFEEMAPEFAAGFLGRMRPDAAAAIMAGMKPESAYTVSTILAGRNANVPTE